MDVRLIRAVIILCIVAAHAKRQEINMCNKDSITKWYKCKPRKVIVNIISDTKETNLRIAPNIVTVKRCMGYVGQMQCVSAKSVNVSVIVKEMSSQKCKEFLVEEHRKCSLVEYSSISKSPLNTVPKCKPNQKWNAAKSRCECHKICTTGSIFDLKSCSCRQ